MDDPATFGDWLRRHRRERDLSREALAELVSCATPTLAKIEQGTRRPSRELAALLVAALAPPPAERERAMLLARRPLAAPADPAAERPPPRPAAPRPPPPTAPAPLVGRAAELALLRERLADPACRVVTIVGPGGVGKTRLALAAVAAPPPRFADGVAWAELAPLVTPAAVAEAIAEAVGCPLRGEGALEPRLLAFLRERALLLALDNLEHLPGAATLLGAITRAAPRVALLLTSRERLRLDGEWIVALDGLAAPPEGVPPDLEAYEAAALFLARARQAGGRVEGPASRAAVARICRLVEGLPLAVELAAAWTPALSCEEIADELRRGLALLARPGAGAPARHSSAEAVFAHSWALLGAEERRALAALATFAGDFTREAAEQVAGAGLATLAALVEKSLLRRREHGGRSRYSLHELVRRLAAARLAPEELAALRARHVAYYGGLLAASLPGLQGGGQAAALATLEPERASLAQAWAWAAEAGDEAAMARSAPALLLMHEMRGRLREAAALFSGAAAARRAVRPAGHTGPDRSLGVICAWEAWARGRGGEVVAAHALLDEAVDLLEGDDELLASTGALGSLGLILLQRGRYGEARAAAERSLALVAPRGLGFFATLHSVFLANILLALGDGPGARAAGEAAVAYGEASGSLRARLLGRCGAALAANAAGDHARAEELARAALGIAAGAHDPFGLGLALLMLGVAARLRGEGDEARYLLAESAEACAAVGDRWNQGRALVQLGAAAAGAGDGAAARRAWAEALQVTLACGIEGVATAAAVELAALAAAEGRPETAGVLAALGALPAADYAARVRVAGLLAGRAGGDAGPGAGGAGAGAAGAASLAGLVDLHPALFAPRT